MGTAKKTITIMVPTYNEEENVIPLSQAIIQEVTTNLPAYDYELIFIDNASKDQTRPRIRQLCAQNPKIRAIFNAKNFGQFNSPFYGLTQTHGDCTILMCADFQDPIEMIPKFVHEWEKGYKIVIGIKSKSRENKFMYFLRSCYYKLIKKMSSVEQIEHFTGFALYDQEFVKVLRTLDDSTPFLRGIVAELGYKRKDIEYEQQERRAGKTHNNWYTLYDAAMLSFTSYTKVGMRIATMLGFVCSALSVVAALIYLVMKLVFWDRFVAGMTPILLGIFLFGSLQLFFIGLLGEYIMTINSRVTKRPLVIEEERINFSTPEELTPEKPTPKEPTPAVKKPE